MRLGHQLTAVGTAELTVSTESIVFAAEQSSGINLFFRLPNNRCRFDALHRKLYMKANIFKPVFRLARPWASTAKQGIVVVSS